MVLFAATTIRMMLENYLKYGIRLNPKNWVLAVVTPEGNANASSSVSCLFCYGGYFTVKASRLSC